MGSKRNPKCETSFEEMEIDTNVGALDWVEQQ
jgi:hypothetical protein